MRPRDREEDDLARLKKVQARVRQLAADHPWFAAHLRDSFEAYNQLHDLTVQLRSKAGMDLEKLPPNPAALDRLNLARFSQSDQRTIGFYRLCGLADLGRVAMIVPRPAATGDVLDDAGRLSVWQARFPVRLEDCHESDPTICVAALPPSLAEEWLESAEAWVRDHASPTTRLVLGLVRLQASLANDQLFRDLADRRKAAVETAARLPCDPENMTAREPKFNEPAEYRQGLRKVTARASDCVNQVREAVKSGGARPLDDALSPGARVRSVELDVKLRETESTLMQLTIGLDNPNFLIADHAEAMVAQRAYFGRVSDELASVLEVGSGKADEKQLDRKKTTRRLRPLRSKADRVRELLSGEVSYKKTKSGLAAEVGYTHPSSLARVKNFDNLWSANEQKLATERAKSQKRMTPLGHD